MLNLGEVGVGWQVWTAEYDKDYLMAYDL